ncbi:hypothetical protein [Caballeronia sp. KNU42]
MQRRKSQRVGLFGFHVLFDQVAHIIFSEKAFDALKRSAHGLIRAGSDLLTD